MTKTEFLLTVPTFCQASEENKEKYQLGDCSLIQ